VSQKKRPNTIVVEPLLAGTGRFAFNGERLFQKRVEVARLLSLVNDDLKQSRNGPLQRWIAARFDWNGREWDTDLQDVDKLLAMGRALGMVKILSPEGAFADCDMPMLQILDRDAARSERSLPKEQQNYRLKYWSYSYVRK